MSSSSLFIVRIWRDAAADGEAGFCASVRAVDAEEATLFRSAAALARYLAESCRRPASSSTPAGGDRS